MKVYLKKKNLIAFAWLFTCCFTTASPQKNDSVRQLREIVVTQDSKSSQIIRSSSPYQQLDKQKLETLHALQVSDAVKHFSGVMVKDYGGIGGLKTVSVRGLGANHTSVSYNGVTVNDTQTGQIDIGRFSLDYVENISLTSGQHDNIFLPASAFASASTLSIITVAPSFTDKNRFNGKASLKVGSFGLVNPAFHTNAKFSDKLSASLSGEWLSEKGNYPYKLRYGISSTDSTSIEKRENTDVKNLRLETALFAHLSDQSKGNIRFYYYQSERGLPGATIFYNTHNFSKQRLWDRTFFTQGNFEHSFSKKWAIQANAKYNHNYLRYLDPTFLGSKGKFEDIFTQDEIYGSVSTLYKALDQLSFSASTDLSTTTMHARREAFDTPTRLTSQSAVAAKWVSERVLSTASLLYTQTFETVKKGSAADNQHKFSPYISASVKPFSNVDFRLRAFLKNSFRLPTFNDLYYPAVGRPQLKPENANQLNFGATFNTSIRNVIPNLTFTADLYQNNVKNKIIVDPTGNLHQWAMTNLDKVRINGLDISAEGTVKIVSNSQFIVGTTYTFQRAIDITGPEKSTYKHQIPYTPIHSGTIRAVLEIPWFSIAYTVLWSGESFSNPYNQKSSSMRGYSDHSISVTKSIDTCFGKVGLSLETLNLSNKNYEIVHNYPMPGRSFRANVSLNF